MCAVAAGPCPGSVAARGAGVSQGPGEPGRARKELAPGSELWGQTQLEALASVPGPPGCPLFSLGLTAGPGAERWWERDTLQMRGGWWGRMGGRGKMGRNGVSGREWQACGGQYGGCRENKGMVGGSEGMGVRIEGALLGRVVRSKGRC